MFRSLRQLPCRLAGLILAFALGHEAFGAAAQSVDSDTVSEQAAREADDHHGHAGGIDYNKPPIDPKADPGMLPLFIFSLVLFGLFVFGARTLVWNPLIAALDQREARVNQAQAEAKAAKEGAEQLLARHDAKMAEVYEQVKEIVAKARKEAEAEKLRIIAEAEGQARDLREKAIADIRKASEDALGQIDREIDRHAAIAVEHVVGHGIG